MHFIINLPKKLAVLLINFYQKTLSPDHGWPKINHPYGYCRHYPSCSQYTKQAIGKFGLLKGVFLGVKRIIKCNPWAQPKIDLIPNSPNCSKQQPMSNFEIGS